MTSASNVPTDRSLKTVEHALQVVFENQALLSEALTHRSAGAPNYERLEFLGDAVLELLVTEAIFKRYPDLDEGSMTRMRVALVRRESLAEVAKTLELGRYIRLGPGERKSGGMHRASILSDVLEAVLGAIYLDQGLECARRVIEQQFDWENLSSLEASGLKDAKTRLQEYLQAQALTLPQYQVVNSEGKDHDRIFTVHVKVPLLHEPVEAAASSIKWAEQMAAQKALDLMEV
jgi:ribonuclease-3